MIKIFFTILIISILLLGCSKANEELKLIKDKSGYIITRYYTGKNDLSNINKISLNKNIGYIYLLKDDNILYYTKEEIQRNELGGIKTRTLYFYNDKNEIIFNIDLKNEFGMGMIRFPNGIYFNKEILGSDNIIKYTKKLHAVKDKKNFKVSCEFNFKNEKISFCMTESVWDGALQNIIIGDDFNFKAIPNIKDNFFIRFRAVYERQFSYKVAINCSNDDLLKYYIIFSIMAHTLREMGINNIYILP